MKKALLAAAAALIALTSVAQNKAIDAMAEKYYGKSGYEVTSHPADEIKYNNLLSIRIGSSKWDFSESLKDPRHITSITCNKKCNKRFLRKIKNAIPIDYIPVASHSNLGMTGKVFKSKITDGEYSGYDEVVTILTGKRIAVLAKIVCKVDHELMAKIARDMNR